MFLFISAFLSLLFVSYAPDPYSVFHRADSVLSSVSTVTYSFNFKGTGALANIIPVLNGKAVLSTGGFDSHPLMELHFTEIVREGAITDFRVPSSYIATSDSIFRIDHTLQTITSAVPTVENATLFDYPPAAVLMEFVLENPFVDEILGDSIAVLSPDTLNGVPCHVFHVYYSLNQAEAIWRIGMNDLIPYSVERMGYYGERQLPGGQLLLLDSVRIHDTVMQSEHHSLGYTYLDGSTLLKPGENAPEVFLADTQGMTVRQRFPADTPVLLCFFSSWDPGSLSALGFLNGVSEEDLDLSIYAVSIWESNDPSFRLSALDLSFSVLLFGNDTAVSYRVSTVPSLVLVSKDGKVLWTTTDVDEEALEQIRDLAV